MEHEVAPLAEVTLFCRDLYGCGGSVRSRWSCGGGSAPAPEVGVDEGSNLFGCSFYGVLEMPRQAGEVARRGNWTGSHRAQMLEDAGSEASHKRHEQQDIDRGEPRAGEDVEELQSVHPRAEGAAVGNVLGCFLFVEWALRQQSARDCRRGQQEQQHECCFHRRQRTPQSE